MDHFCVSLACYFPQAVPAVCLNSVKSHLGFINVDKSFTSICVAVHLVFNLPAFSFVGTENSETTVLCLSNILRKRKYILKLTL